MKKLREPIRRLGERTFQVEGLARAKVLRWEFIGPRNNKEVLMAASK